MADVQYTNTSLYSKTTIFGNYLDVANFPPIPRSADDVVFTINKTYQYRPDLLAHDLYGDTNLWWVFAIRNPNTIKDPIFDMRIGNRIFLPKKTAITSALG